MAVMTRRLHMGCGETLHSHLPESFTKLPTRNDMQQRNEHNSKTTRGRKGRFWK